MTTKRSKQILGYTAALSLGLFATFQAAEAAPPASATSTPVGAPGYAYGPGMMGPGMMYNWTPEQRQQHWAQMRQLGSGPGMMWSLTPEQRQQHWEQMRQLGYGRGMMGPGMMGPGGWSGTGNGGSQSGTPPNGNR